MCSWAGGEIEWKRKNASRKEGKGIIKRKVKQRLGQLDSLKEAWPAGKGKHTTGLAPLLASLFPLMNVQFPS